MTEQTQTPEFFSKFQEKYGKYYPKPANFALCCESVYDGRTSITQCTRKNGHGPHGAYCKQHDPVAKAAKSDARYAKFKAELDEKRKNREAEKAKADAIEAATAGMVEALRAIVMGADKPQWIAAEALGKWDEANR